MISSQNEIEVKFDADKVAVKDFEAFVFESGLNIEKYIKVKGPDRFFSSSGGVLRHRLDMDTGRSEITLKMRKSKDSTRDRFEIDWKIDERTKTEDIAPLLEALGFGHILTIVKEARIFLIKLTANANATFVVYDVWKEEKGSEVLGTRKRFIEVEIEKGSNISVDTAKKHLNTWTQKIQAHFKLDEPLNQSLFEIYSGMQTLVI